MVLRTKSKYALDFLLSNGPAGTVPSELARWRCAAGERNDGKGRATSASGPCGGMGTAALGAELGVRILLFVAFL